MNNTLVVDLDGTITTDTLHESIVSILKKNPFLIFKLFYFIFKGKLAFKNYVSSKSNIDISSLPYNKEALSYIMEKKKKGYHIVLATGSPASIANKVSKHLGIFDTVFASTDKLNLTGMNKAKLLKEKYGNAFTYMGNSPSDNYIWDIANTAVIVSKSKNILKNQSKLELYIKSHKNSLKHIWKAMRPHHWTKNLLVFVAGSINFEITSLSLFLKSGITFASFCCISSCVYILNDIIDLSHDRASINEKKRRPIASGHLDILAAAFLASLLFFASIILSSTISYQISEIILAYFALNILYSFYVKKIILIDTLCLTLFYILRIDAGFFSTHLTPSFWLITFSFFLFLGLALFKRYIEILSLKEVQLKKLPGRTYKIQMKNLVYGTAISSHICSIIVFFIYSQSLKAASLYKSTNILSLSIIPISLFFITLHRKIKKNDTKFDIISLALKDTKMQLIFLLFFVIFVTAKFYG